MRSRKLSKRIEIWQTSNVSDGFGGNTVLETFITKSWAEIITLNDTNRSTDIGITSATNTIKIRLRKRNDIRYNSINQFIKYRGAKYIIKNQPFNVDFRDDTIEIIAVKEEIKTVEDIAPFITTWRTTIDNESITIPTSLTAVYNYNITTSDNQTFTNITGDKTITFSTAGDYDIYISGTFPSIKFNNNGDKDKIIDIKQWGNIVWSSFQDSFFGCNNLIGTYIDYPNSRSVTNMNRAFKDCVSFIGKTSDWDVSNVEIMGNMFFNAESFNSDLSNWDVSNVSNMNNMFCQASNFNQNISSWNIVYVYQMNLLMQNTNLSNNNYNSILIGWVETIDKFVLEGGNYNATPSPHFGNAVCSGQGLGAKNKLINKYGWVITDGTP